MIAVTNDSEGKISQAINFYVQALEYFIPALECELYSLTNCKGLSYRALGLNKGLIKDVCFTTNS